MEERHNEESHVRLIEAILHGRGNQTVEEVVRRSWQRCVSDFGLHPTQARSAVVVERRELRERRERLGPVYPIARAEMQVLFRQIQRADLGIVLTDHEGVVLSCLGREEFTEVANRSGLREGALWSEAAQGTNGMGTCLSERSPTLIDRNDHFFTRNTLLTCAAAPIFDPSGRLAAVLDISSCGDPIDSVTLALVSLTAQTIENRALQVLAQRQRLLRFHRRPEVVSTLGEGMMAIDEDGRVSGLNSAGLKLLGYDSHEDVCGQPIHQVFKVTADGLMEAGRSAHMMSTPVWSAHRHRFYVTLQQPPSEGGEASTQDRNATRQGRALDELDAGDPVMARGLRLVRRLLDCDLPILLLGETGTGKGYLARAVHDASSRADGPFVAVNCAAIPESLIESELFGYRAGAFTGAAREGYAGRIQQANGGTLFLDEIGDMSLTLQVRLLSVLEEKAVVPLGATDAVPLDVRIISATHRDLSEWVAQGLFRDDLYYRINGVTLTLPPLRDRQDRARVIERLAQAEGGADLELEPALLEFLTAQPWPGNLRQLRNVLRAMIALSRHRRLTRDDLPPELLSDAQSPGAVSAPPDDPLHQAERDAIEQVLRGCNWQISAAARDLGISRKTLYRKLRRHGLKRP